VITDEDHQAAGAITRDNNHKNREINTPMCGQHTPEFEFSTAQCCPQAAADQQAMCTHKMQREAKSWFETITIADTK